MYSYHLNKKKSQTFVEYYMEDNDKINIHYGDGSVLVTNNTKQNKKNLNSIQEGQLAFDRPKYRSIWSEKRFLVFAIRAFSAMELGIVAFASIPVILNTNFLASIDVVCLNLLVGFPYLAPNIINYGKYFLNKAFNRKFGLFMKYKDDLNSRVELVEEKIDSKSMNPVANRKSSILNLSINDVHFMKYSELKKITKAIDVAKLEENRINAFSEEKVKTLVKVKRNKGGYELC